MVKANKVEIEAIANRIRKEFIKHPGLDWAKIAAYKIHDSIYNLDGCDLDIPIEELIRKHEQES